MSESVPNDTEMNEAEPQDSGADGASALSLCEAERAELQDRILRTHAEFQNFRRRVEKERLELSEYASMEAVRSLLPVFDDFDRA
ncbi:MAG: nucleotide exchange factor GrpE, partial [Acidobacteriota bacterium]